MKTIKAKNGKTIQVFDNLFDLGTRLTAYEYMRNSLYRIGWKDSETEENVKYQYLHSGYSQEDLNNLPLYHKIMESPAAKLVEGLTLKKSVVNLSVPSDVNFIHAHPEKKVILYYANIDWRDGWHGETLFYNEERTEVEYANPYTPGRLIVFDGNFPHTIRPQSHIASNYRFTFALTFDDK